MLKRQYPGITTSKIQEISKLLSAYPTGLRDRSSAVHLSASAFVPVGNTVLFIRHPYLKTVLLPAGHVEPNELPLQTAIREFHEETGYQVNPQSQQLIDANVIEIPANPLRNEGPIVILTCDFYFVESHKRLQMLNCRYFSCRKKTRHQNFNHIIN
ncbi:NUDIX domain-containing protein [Lentilactobacillus parafarraginis]|uniref:NUDIX domain-containing protein n=1 Tax=Lentilactobacillus parafarraginis TaxID=390842 RepID=UPI000AA66CCB|nr:NUDIX domain-containing protein [Lentilactobacillus parafarraginis]